MAEYIEREKIFPNKVFFVNENDPLTSLDELIKRILSIPAADVVEVCRCENCIYYHKAHVLCNDGTEKDYSEFFPEAFGSLGFVSSEYGINVGGKCEIEKNCGYAEDKSVFRQPNDFCSRGKRRAE